MNSNCKYCDGFGVLEQSDEVYCSHCVAGKDVEAYFQRMNEKIKEALDYVVTKNSEALDKLKNK